MSNLRLPDPKDAELLLLLKEDNRNAYDAIYKKYWSKLYISAYNLLRDRMGAEDVVQEVLVQLWLKRSTNTIEILSAYLYGAVRFQVLKAIRDGKARQGLFEDIENLDEAYVLSVENIAEQHLIEQDINRNYERGLAELPEKCREIFLLSRNEYLSNKEIAERLGISLKTVENQMTIALRKLRASMGDVLFWSAVTLTELWLKK